MTARVLETELLWDEWRWAEDEVWDAWDALLATAEGRDERHRRYERALVDEELAARRLAVALARSDP